MEVNGQGAERERPGPPGVTVRKGARAAAARRSGCGTGAARAKCLSLCGLCAVRRLGVLQAATNELATSISAPNLLGRSGILGRSCSSATYGLGGGVRPRWCALFCEERTPHRAAAQEERESAPPPFHSTRSQPQPTSNLQPKTPNQPKPKPEPLHIHSHTNTLTMLRFGSKWAYVAPDAASKEIEVEYGT